MDIHWKTFNRLISYYFTDVTLASEQKYSLISVSLNIRSRFSKTKIAANRARGKKSFAC